MHHVRISLVVAATILCLTAPAVTHAEGTLAHPGPCPASPSEGEWAAIYCARNEITAATTARREAEEAAPATFLHVTTEFVRESGTAGQATYKEPGETEIELESSPFAFFTFRPNMGPAILNAREWPEGHVADAELLLKEPTGEATEFRAEIPRSNQTVHVEASCEHPNKVYRFTVEARGGSGSPIVRTGQFKLGQHLSARWCAETKRKEVLASARQRAQGRRHYEERVRREREKLLAEDERFEYNCRAIGGIPARIVTREGSWYIVCHSTTGGIIPVP